MTADRASPLLSLLRRVRRYGGFSVRPRVIDGAEYARSPDEFRRICPSADECARLAGQPLPLVAPETPPGRVGALLHRAEQASGVLGDPSWSRTFLQDIPGVRPRCSQ